MSTGQAPDAEFIRGLSVARGEPGWMLEIRLEALDDFGRLPPSNRHRSLTDSGFDDLRARSMVRRPSAGPGHDPAGMAAGDDGEVAYRRNLEDLQRRGVVICDLETAVREHPELVRPHLARIVASSGGRFTALNTLGWSGGWFVHVPPGVEVEQPIQVHSRATAGARDRFERTLIIAEERSVVQYVDGCSAPVYSPDPLRSTVAEVVVGPGAVVTHTAVQNWSGNVSNLVTKGAVVEAGGHMEWVEGNIGARMTVARPSIHLAGRGATGAVTTVDLAGGDRYQDTGAEIVHAAPETGSTVVVKAVVGDGGRTSHHVVVRGAERGRGCSSRIRRDALILDQHSGSEARFGTDLEGDELSNPAIDRRDAVRPVDAAQLFYLMTRGLSEGQARAMIVNGFVEPVVGSLPLEYAVEWSRLIELEMEDSVG